MKVLVKFKADWADEFYVYGMQFFDSLEEWKSIFDEFFDLREKGLLKGTWSFGSNEWFEAEDFSKDDFETHVITDENAEFLMKLFGNNWGHFPDLASLIHDSKIENYDEL